MKYNPSATSLKFSMLSKIKDDKKNNKKFSVFASKSVPYKTVTNITYFPKTSSAFSKEKKNIDFRFSTLPKE